jgi:hypothetical protein
MSPNPFTRRGLLIPFVMSVVFVRFRLRGLVYCVFQSPFVLCSDCSVGTVCGCVVYKLCDGVGVWLVVEMVWIYVYCIYVYVPTYLAGPQDSLRASSVVLLSILEGGWAGLGWAGIFRVV